MTDSSSPWARNVTLYPWHHFLYNLSFWQATWFLFFQDTLSAAEALLLYVVYDLSVTALEVPSGYMSDRIGRRFTLLASAFVYLIGLVALGAGTNFAVLCAGQILLGMARAFVSGTDESLLYQSLAAQNRTAEMETQSLRAWRFGFIGLGLSAVTGGAMALWSPSLPFYASAVAIFGALIIAFLFAEPPSDTDSDKSEIARLRSLMGYFRKPVLLWLFVLGVIMYGYSHIPFIFGQPFISETLAQIGLQTEAPLVSGTVTALMMGLSVLVSLIAPTLRNRFGLASILLLAFAIQVGLAAALSVLGSLFAIALLLLRMVPDSLSTAFIQARLQHDLGDATRATFLSLKSFLGRLAFAGSVALAAGSTSSVGAMPLADIQSILWVYAVIGLVILAALAVAALRLNLEPDQS